MFQRLFGPFHCGRFGKNPCKHPNNRKQGALENQSRPEGQLKDRVVALPLLVRPRDKETHGTLRLYCIRISEQLLILGGGGIKTTDTYEENESLLSQVSLLQEIDKQLFLMETNGKDLASEIYNLTLFVD